MRVGCAGGWLAVSLVVAGCADAPLSPDAGSAAADAGPGCPNDLPASCGVAPSYAARVAPILERRCTACHGADGPNSPALTTYQQVHAWRGPVLNHLYACDMPPDHVEPPSPEERRDVLMWLVCGAPDN